MRDALGILLLVMVLCFAASAQTNELTYQGRLTAGSIAANAAHDFEFRLCTTATADCTMTPPDGGMLGTLTRPGVTVSNGVFTVKLDFDQAIFNGADRWLEILVKPTGGTTFTLLAPRQRVTSAPYSIKSLNSEIALTATNATQLDGRPPSDYVLTTDPRMNDARSPLPGSSNYIQNNPPGQQVSSSFNIGEGVINGNLTSFGNVAFGTTPFPGARVSMLQSNASLPYALRVENSTPWQTGDPELFGIYAKSVNASTKGTGGYFEGGFQGIRGVSTNPSFTTVSAHSGVSGYAAGGNPNFGLRGEAFSTWLSGTTNYGVWARSASLQSLTGTYYGLYAEALGGPGAVNYGVYGLASGPLSTNYGVYGSAAGQSSTNYAGYFQGNVHVTGNTTIGGNSVVDGRVGIGTTAPIEKLHVEGHGLISGFVTANAGLVTYGNLFVDGSGGIGTSAPQQKLSVSDGLNIDQNDLNNGTIINALRLGSNSGEGLGSRRTPGPNRWGLDFYTGSLNRMVITNTGNVGIGTNSPADKLHVNGTVRLGTLAAGGIDVLCYSPLNQITLCTSSLRYKTNIAPLSSGLSQVHRLRPVTFNWKTDNKADLGLVAEEVAEVDPLLARYNNKGEIEGVKYDRIGVVLITAVKEQQAQIEDLKKKVERQEQENKAMKKFICSTNKEADLCKEQ